MDVRPVGRPDDSGSRRRILAVAAALFNEHGYASTSLRAIATVVGMTPPSLYWYFPSKQAILEALVRQTLDDFLDAVEAEVVGPSPEEQLRQFARAHVLNALVLPRIGPHEAQFGILQMTQFLGEDKRAELVAGMRRHLDLLRGILREGIARGCFREVDVTSTAFAILSMCGHVNSWWNAQGPISADQVAADYEELAIRMVRRGP